MGDNRITVRLDDTQREQVQLMATYLRDKFPLGTTSIVRRGIGMVWEQHGAAAQYMAAAAKMREEQGDDPGMVARP
jgi:hypothetical protein